MDWKAREVLTRETRNCVAREMGSARTRATHHDPVFFFPISSETALPRCPVAGEGCGERRARCVVRDASRRRPVEPEEVFLGDNCAASRIFEPRGAPPGTRGARRGFRRRAPRTHLGTVGGARVPRGRRNECHAREPRRALEHRHSFSSLPKPKKKSFQRDSNPVRPRLGFCRTWRARTSVNFLSRRPCPRPLVFPCLQETDGRGNVRVP